MTPARFRHLAEQIAGRYWKAHLPAKIGKCRSMVWEYATGKREVPATVGTLMEVLADRGKP